MKRFTLFKNSKGVTLVEVLVAVVVTSIGLLGIAGLEIYAKQSGFEASQRTTAAMLAHDIMEKMRANPTALSSYVGKTVGSSSLSAPGSNCSAASCDSTAMAVYDVWEWEQRLDGANATSGGTNTAGLASPKGCITGPAAGGAGEYTVALAWRGTTPLTNPTSSTCGEDTAVYGTGNAYRRVMVFTFFVSDDGVS